MLGSILVVAAVGLLGLLLKTLASFLKAYGAAKASNLHYELVPIHSFSRALEVTRPLWLPVVNLIPESLRGNWYMLITEGKLWKYNYNLFRRVGHDNFMTVTSVGEVEFYTADPDVISQIVTRKTDFPKPLHVYKLLDVYGRNVVTTEGHEWRRHRKIVGPPFTEKNNHLVWNESVYQARAMMAHLLDGNELGTPTIGDIEPSISYVALGVISKAGYGVRLGWKDEKTGEMKYLEADQQSGGSELGRDWIEGKTHQHTMSFGDALYLLAKYLLLVLLLPEVLLKNLPFKTANKALEAYKNWDNYMKEMLSARRKELSSSTEEAHDLLANLVRNIGQSSGLVEKAAGSSAAAAAAAAANEAGGLSDSEILGNAFVLMVAGHETSAGALEHSLYMMAVDPRTQRKLQAELDELFGGKPPTEWDYETDFPRLFEGYAGAILAEVLRLIPPALAPPKWAVNRQTLTVDGRTCTLPAGTEITLDLAAVHRNPKHWPHAKHDPNALEYSGKFGDDDDTDLGEFKPERWLNQPESSAAINNNNGHANGNGKAKQPNGRATEQSAEAESLSVNTSADNAASFFRPARGAYLPFSEGFRSCMGRRFAQVEVMAILAVVFQKYSVELAVDKWSTDEQVDGMSEAERRDVWLEAKKDVREGFANGMESRITERMRNRTVPMRFVKRGHERFAAEKWY